VSECVRERRVGVVWWRGEAKARPGRQATTARSGAAARAQEQRLGGLPGAPARCWAGCAWGPAAGPTWGMGGAPPPGLPAAGAPLNSEMSGAAGARSAAGGEGGASGRGGGQLRRQRRMSLHVLGARGTRRDRAPPAASLARGCLLPPLAGGAAGAAAAPAAAAHQNETAGGSAAAPRAAPAAAAVADGGRRAQPWPAIPVRAAAGRAALTLGVQGIEVLGEAPLVELGPAGEQREGVAHGLRLERHRGRAGVVLVSVSRSWANAGRRERGRDDAVRCRGRRMRALWLLRGRDVASDRCEQHGNAPRVLVEPRGRRDGRGAPGRAPGLLPQNHQPLPAKCPNAHTAARSGSAAAQASTNAAASLAARRAQAPRCDRRSPAPLRAPSGRTGRQQRLGSRIAAAQPGRSSPPGVGAASA
jgi:hypothetical protein